MDLALIPRECGKVSQLCSQSTLLRLALLHWKLWQPTTEVNVLSECVYRVAQKESGTDMHYITHMYVHLFLNHPVLLKKQHWCTAEDGLIIFSARQLADSRRPLRRPSDTWLIVVEEDATPLDFRLATAWRKLLKPLSKQNIASIVWNSCFCSESAR